MSSASWADSDEIHVTWGRSSAAQYSRAMHSGRALVDYALHRRRALADVASGVTPITEACDASRYLLRAARFHGVATETDCPLCRKDQLIHVFWIFGDALGPMANSARGPYELEDLATRVGEFTVHQVEVCRSCSWNFLIASFLMGQEGKRNKRPGGGRTSGGRTARA